MGLIVKRFIYCTIILTCFFQVSCAASLSQHTHRDLELGEEALNNQNYDEAIGHFRSYLEKSPQDGEAHLQLGLALLKKGEFKGSRQ